MKEIFINSLNLTVKGFITSPLLRRTKNVRKIGGNQGETKVSNHR